MVLSWYDLDQLPADSCGCGWEWFVGKERVDIGYWKIVKYHLFWRFRRLVGDGSTLFVVEFSEVSSAGVEKVAGRTCWRVSRPTSGWLERFCLGGGNFWTTRNPLWRGILQGTDVFCPFLLLFLLIRFFVSCINGVWLRPLYLYYAQLLSFVARTTVYAYCCAEGRWYVVDHYQLQHLKCLYCRLDRIYFMQFVGLFWKLSYWPAYDCIHSLILHNWHSLKAEATVMASQKNSALTVYKIIIIIIIVI